MSKFLWSSLLVMLSLQVAAQKNERDSLRAIHKPTGLRIGTDLIAIGKTIAQTPLQSWEISADVDLGRYYPILELGGWSREAKLVNGLYNNDGKYFRVGVDINFLLKDPDKNMFFIGMRYGRAQYSERVLYSIAPELFPTVQQAASNPDAAAGWIELTTGLRVKVWRGFWMGYTGRMKFLPHTKNTPGFESYDIPGFGLPFKGLYWGFNYQVFWRIPFERR
ncbi:MAG TPA: DUF6048 family protein [Cyclobacteriaceae bacterium]|nr:hypothetical protein [Cytophagales bacterium]HNT50445.1 DUF6048 family protein [Cyclobacteriaceae bacterium]HRE67532.1 DUF6048 family protein [Cyclobacteriaceae bacterium]HRF33361.1 DUF6048 family protein [Cyclobacteriaceae bacterium]